MAPAARMHCEADFRSELKTLLRIIKVRFDTLEDALKSEERKRLSDGKSAMSKIKAKFGVHRQWEGHLATALAKLPYATQFRDKILEKTGQ